MRILVIAADYPWPPTGGSRIRLANTLDALAQLGEVELLSIVPQTRDSSDFEAPPVELSLDSVDRITVDLSPSGRLHSLKSLVASRLPVGIPLSPAPVVRRVVGDVAGHRYDLVWFFTVRAFVWAGCPHAKPTIVDIDDLEDQKIKERVELTAIPKRVRRAAFELYWAVQIARWRRLHAQIATLTTPVVCSSLDARRSGLTNARVIANGFRAPEAPAAPRVARTRTILFQGTLRYPPNADAAMFLANRVAPQLARIVPDVQVRLVGVVPPELAERVTGPNVQVVGRVPEMRSELERAGLVIVPLRIGSGTRIKILEAFAYKVPVVSTTLGAEGLGLADRVHALIADDEEGLARACAEVLSDADLSQSLVQNAYELFVERYELSVIRQQIRELVADTVS